MGWRDQFQRLFQRLLVYYKIICHQYSAPLAEARTLIRLR